MAIFISYSRQDVKFVDALVANLVAARHHVWMDRWELGIGDSLTQHIQEALVGSDAILVILSRNSVASEWCKRELTAGLVRELEEKKTLVMPCVIDHCEIPLFLRDKLYADFRSDPDEAFRLVDRSLSRISNPSQGRAESPDFFTDFALD
jgi:TIR domain